MFHFPYRLHGVVLKRRVKFILAPWQSMTGWKAEYRRKCQREDLLRIWNIHVSEFGGVQIIVTKVTVVFLSPPPPPRKVRQSILINKLTFRTCRIVACIELISQRDFGLNTWTFHKSVRLLFSNWTTGSAAHTNETKLGFKVFNVPNPPLSNNILIIAPSHLTLQMLNWAGGCSGNARAGHQLTQSLLANAATVP
jgi:hypothetical protein